jgi:hypothetical protein
MMVVVVVCLPSAAVVRTSSVVVVRALFVSRGGSGFGGDVLSLSSPFPFRRYSPL